VKASRERTPVLDGLGVLLAAKSIGEGTAVTAGAGLPIASLVELESCDPVTCKHGLPQKTAGLQETLRALERLPPRVGSGIKEAHVFIVSLVGSAM